MTGENVVVITLAALISVALNWFPRLKDWYDVKPDWQQSIIMLALTLLAAGVVIGSKCAGIELPFLQWSGSCDTAGWRELVNLWIAAIVSGAVSFVALPKPQK